MADTYEEDELEFAVGDSEELEIEVVDDTPEEDQGRAKLADDSDEQEAELDNYSAKVQKRINQINHKYHDARREKEALERQNAEAIKLAQTILAENERLKQTLTWGQQEYTKEAQAKIEYAEKLAEDKYRRAYEAGDTEGTLTAQRELNKIEIEKSKLVDYVNSSLQGQGALQQENNQVYSNPTPAPEPPTAPRDYRAEEWASRNPWFGKDEEMTSLAYGLHQKLVNSGVDPTSDEYYQQIDSNIRSRFPERFNRQKKSSPVAPVGRTTAPKKVTLSASEVAIAKRLGLTTELYAQYKLKGATING
jgi:hypothetical protein